MRDHKSLTDFHLAATNGSKSALISFYTFRWYMQKKKKKEKKTRCITREREHFILHDLFYGSFTLKPKSCVYFMKLYFGFDESFIC